MFMFISRSPTGTRPNYKRSQRIKHTQAHTHTNIHKHSQYICTCSHAASSESTCSSYIWPHSGLIHTILRAKEVDSYTCPQKFVTHRGNTAEWTIFHGRDTCKWNVPEHRRPDPSGRSRQLKAWQELWTVKATVKDIMYEHQIMLHETRFYGRDFEMLQ